MKEAPFLAMIQEAPDNRTNRLVHADWLEEHGDTRGELIRIEEEMRTLPVYSDRFWQLKPRRNELRCQAPPDWLQALSYGTEREPVFRHGYPDGWRERWRLIRESSERWRGTALGDVGGHEKEIAAVETRLGRVIPPSLREFVAFVHDAGSRIDPGHDRILFRDWYVMQDLIGVPAISLLLQGEGDIHWAVRHADLGIADPPIYTFMRDYDQGHLTIRVADEYNRLDADTVSDFVLRYSMAYIHPEGGGFGIDIRDPTALLDQLHAAMPVYCRFGISDVFETDNMIVQLHHWPERDYMDVKVFKPTPREKIPAFLWDQARKGGSFHGIFIPDRGAVPPVPPNRASIPALPDDDIPF